MLVTSCYEHHTITPGHHTWASRVTSYIRSSSSTRATKDPKTRRPSKIQDPTADAPARAPAAQDRVTRAPWRVIIFQKIGVRDSPGGKGKSPDVPPGTPPSTPVEFYKPDPPCEISLQSGRFVPVFFVQAALHPRHGGRQRGGGDGRAEDALEELWK